MRASRGANRTGAIRLMPAVGAGPRRRVGRLRALILATVAAASFSSACARDGTAVERTVTSDPGSRPSQERDPEAPSSLVESSCGDRDLRPDEDNLETVEAATLCLVNAERRARDGPALGDDSRLAEAADRKSQHMVRHRYFAHVGPDDRNVTDWARDSGYVSGGSGYKVGENLGWASGNGATPEMIVLGWMRSSGHRRNLLDERFRDSGIGVALGAPRPEGGGGATYTHMLGASG